MLRLLLPLLFVAFAGSANAFYSNAEPPAGWGGSASSGWNYSRTASNAAWSSGKVNDLIKHTVGGRTITMPASMRMAANAGRYVASAARFTPGGIVTSAVASWLLTEGISWVDGQWQREIDPEIFYGSSYYNTGGNPATNASTADSSCAKRAVINGHGYYRFIEPNGCETAPSLADYYSGNFLGYTTTRIGCSTGYFWVDGACSQVGVIRSPATETDWNRFENKPVPDQVANDTPGPLPVRLPSINPDPAGNPQPLTVPTGDPVPVPQTIPQQYRQPATDIVPSPTTNEPWRVDERPREIIGTDPAGLPQPTGTTAQPGAAEDELITCGLPGKPKCLIDEQDTPSPTTANPAPAPQPQTEVDAATKATRDIIADVPGKLGPFPTISWAFQLPSACGPILTPAFAPYLTQIDVCQFQGTFHDIMSVVWILGGLFGAISMFWRDQLLTP